MATKQRTPSRPPARRAPPPAPRQQPAALRPAPARAPTQGNGGRAGVPAQMSDLQRRAMQYAGLGVSLRPEDNITPSIAVLQPLSPQVLAGPAQIEEARAGDFWLRGAAAPIVAGDEGFWFQPVAMTEHWFEFIPREQGGGFVARYDVERDDQGRVVPPRGAEQDEENQYRYTFVESGNNCIHYRFVAGFVWKDGVGLEYVIPFHGTGHTVARTWNTKWTRKRFPRSGQPMPACLFLYHLTTSQRTNKQGTWFQIDVGEGESIEAMADVVGDPEAAFDMGVALAQAFGRGERQAATPEYEADATQTASEATSDDVPY